MILARVHPPETATTAPGRRSAVRRLRLSGQWNARRRRRRCRGRSPELAVDDEQPVGRDRRGCGRLERRVPGLGVEVSSPGSLLSRRRLATRVRAGRPSSTWKLRSVLTRRTVARARAAVADRVRFRVRFGPEYGPETSSEPDRSRRQRTALATRVRRPPHSFQYVTASTGWRRVSGTGRDHRISIGTRAKARASVGDFRTEATSASWRRCSIVSVVSESMGPASRHQILHGSDDVGSIDDRRRPLDTADHAKIRRGRCRCWRRGVHRPDNSGPTSPRRVAVRADRGADGSGSHPSQPEADPAMKLIPCGEYSSAMGRFTASSVTTSHDQRSALPFDGPRIAAPVWSECPPVPGPASAGAAHQW